MCVLAAVALQPTRRRGPRRQTGAVAAVHARAARPVLVAIVADQRLGLRHAAPHLNAVLRIEVTLMARDIIRTIGIEIDADALGGSDVLALAADPAEIARTGLDAGGVAGAVTPDYAEDLDALPLAIVRQARPRLQTALAPARERTRVARAVLARARGARAPAAPTARGRSAARHDPRDLRRRFAAVTHAARADIAAQRARALLFDRGGAHR